MTRVQPMLGSTVRCGGQPVDEVAHVVADPILLEVSNIVVRGSGTLRLVPIGMVNAVDEKTVELRCTETQLAECPLKTLGQVFLCPYHLSIYDASGTVLDGPAPRPLDVLPIRISPSGDIEVIDIEYKAGRREEIRIA